MPSTILLGTSRDGIIWDTDARYNYYAHGPLERTEIGHDKLQGTDYVYNLHGWLKAMNHPTLTTANDPGGDNGQPGNFGADEWGMQLNYYNGDFDRTGSQFSSDHSSYLSPERELFNGNISSWASHIAHREGTLEYEQLTGYKFRYDELNRLTRSNFHFHTLNLAWLSTPDYDADYSYDANGNILTLNRNAHTALVLGMDELTYNYYPGTNQLEYVEDDVPAGNFDVDIDNQNPENYVYDELGNLTKDVAEGIDTILWTVQGKVREVHKDNGDALLFLYDGNGNRVMKEYKTPTDTVVTYYTRDAQGNSMAIHERTRPDSMYEYRIKKLPIYGSDRIGVYKPDLLYKRQAPEDCEGGCCCLLSACYNKDMNWHSGMFTRDIGKRAYQLSDHLGNVRVTFSDVKHSTLDVNGLPNSIFVDVISYNNYFNFGMLAVDRHFSSNSYRFGWNTQEKVDEIAGRGNHYTAPFWEYDPRVVHRWNLDPRPDPSFSPYAITHGNPIMFSDILGDSVKFAGTEEEMAYDDFKAEVQSKISHYQSKVDKGKNRFKGRLKKFQKVAEELEELESSEEIFRIRMGENITAESGAGNIRYNWEEKEVDVNILDFGDFNETQKVSHELKHAHQLLEGEIDLIFSGGYGATYDIRDEEEAYERANLFYNRFDNRSTYISNPLQFAKESYPKIIHRKYDTRVKHINDSEMKMMIQKNRAFMQQRGYPLHIYKDWRNDL